MQMFPFENLENKHLNAFEPLLFLEMALQRLAQSWGRFWLISNELLSKSLTLWPALGISVTSSASLYKLFEPSQRQ